MHKLSYRIYIKATRKRNFNSNECKVSNNQSVNADRIQEFKGLPRAEVTSFPIPQQLVSAATFAQNLTYSYRVFETFARYRKKSIENTAK